MSQFKHAFKGVLKNKTHSILNIIGFAVGLSCSIIVFLYVQKILSYETQHAKHERIYRYGVQMTIGDVTNSQSTCNYGVGPLLKDYIKGVENYVRVGNFGEMLIKKETISFKETNFVFMDSTAFDVFTFDFIEGNSDYALNEPDQIVLTKTIAQKYFGDEMAVGNILEIEGVGDVKVVGVINDIEENPVFNANAIISFSSLIKGANEQEIYSPRNFSSGMSYALYFLFKPGFTEEGFLNEFQSYYDEYMAETDRIQYKSIVEPIGDIYLHSKIWVDWSESNRKFLFGFISIGIFILLLACINYINIASSTAITRVKEIAIKKVVGSSKFKVILQILFESVVLCIISLIIAFALTESILNFTPFNDVIGTNLELKYSNVPVILFSCLITLVVGIISGFLPAIFLSKISPSRSLYGKNNGKLSKGTLRNVLITVQLIISIVAVILSILMKNQINFMLNKNLGFDKDNVIVLQINDENVRNKIQSFKNELVKFHGVESVSFSSSTPGFTHMGNAFKWESSDGEMQGHAFRELMIDHDYFKTMGIEIVAGSMFSDNGTSSDSTVEFMVNEKLVETLGWKEPIGKRNEYGMVVGVVKDYNYSSLHGEILPMYIAQLSRRYRILNIKLNGNNIEESIKYIESVWKSNLPDYEFSYSFLNDKIAFFYENDIRQKKLTNIFSILCIIISALGLFSMISLANARKVKEVAIRKVHGASIIQILMVLYKNTFYLICIASVISIPLVLKVYNIWMQNFNYKTGFTISPYIVSIFGAILISLIISVSYSLKIARSNPVESLRYE